jgi:hypothetical protein
MVLDFLYIGVDFGLALIDLLPFSGRILSKN